MAPCCPASPKDPSSPSSEVRWPGLLFLWRILWSLAGKPSISKVGCHRLRTLCRRTREGLEHWRCCYYLTLLLTLRLLLLESTIAWNFRQFHSSIIWRFLWLDPTITWRLLCLLQKDDIKWRCVLLDDSFTCFNIPITWRFLLRIDSYYLILLLFENSCYLTLPLLEDSYCACLY